MSLQLHGLPLIDRPDVATLLADGRFGRWSQHVADLSRDGFCVVELGDAVFQRACGEVIAAQEQRLAAELEDWEAGRSGAPRVQDGWRHHEAVRRLALHPDVLDLLRHAYGREPFAFQTLNFAVGSEQPYHSDAVHFHSLPQGFMCGVWIPLEDVEPDSGPLIYYSGSHQLGYHSAGSLGLSPAHIAAEPHPQRLFESLWQADVERHGLQVEQFLPRRGQVLIWHANLLHGGSPVVNKKARRWSQVVHYYFENCLYTTPLNSFPSDQGGTDLRNPFDISTGRRRWTQTQWQALMVELQIPTEKLNKQAKARKPLQGMIDLITPSQVIGWVSHSELPLTEVRLFQGTQLIATASIDIARPDVAERLARPGAFGFQLNIPDSHPDPGSGEPLRLLAMTADGSFSFPLFLPQDGGELTAEHFSVALGPEWRGLRGHFDGLSLNGKVLHGWCYSRSLGSATVWLQAEGLPPRELSCNLDRPGMAAQGHEEACGFALPLHLWPEAAGRKVWASFDPSGVLRLPPLHPVQLPLEQSA